MADEKEIVIDGINATLGRLASYAAKQALQGNSVVIVNAEKVIILGNRAEIAERYKKWVKQGGSSLKGPKVVRTSERILKRTIRGMVPHKYGRGSDAMDIIRCYDGVPAKYANVKKITAGKEKGGKFITLGELVSLIK
jgi:large subunit ribosomal protein L13